MHPHRMHRMTSQRRVILEELKATGDHPTADELYERVRRLLPHISRGTVYRNLGVLAAQGVIQMLDQSGAQRRFDGNPLLHYHIRCVECNALEDVAVEKAGEGRLADPHGYEVLGMRIEYLGVCPRCRRRSEGSGEPRLG